MAARRLLIVMLILLGLSTLAAALVPQHSLRDSTTGSTTTTRPETTTTAEPPPGRSLSVEILVGAKKVPVVADPICKKAKPECEPLHVGDQLSLQVLSKKQAQLAIPSYGLLSVASRDAPAFFDLLPQEPGRIGVLFASSQKVAATIVVLSAKDAAKAIKKQPKKARSRARGGSGPA